MLWRIVQLSVAFAVYAANIHWQWTDNGYIVGAWAFMASYTVTVFPFTVYDWWYGKAARAEEAAYRRSIGMSVGWRRHLPWNTKRDVLIAKKIRTNGRIRRDGSAGRRFIP